MMCLLLFLSRIFMGYTVVLHPGCTACLLPGIQDNLVITVFCSYLSYLLSGSRWAVLYYIIDCTFMGPAQSVLLESYWHLTKLHCHSQPTSSFSFLWVFIRFYTWDRVSWRHVQKWWCLHTWLKFLIKVHKKNKIIPMCRPNPGIRVLYHAQLLSHLNLWLNGWRGLLLHSRWKQNLVET